jgi:hypothetical protein
MSAGEFSCSDRGNMPNFPVAADPKFVTTVGETFSDGSILDLVASPSSGQLALLFRRAGKKKIAAQIQHFHCIYQPPDLDEAMARAIRFPRDAESCGSTGKLLRRIRLLFEQYAGLPQPESALMAAWAASSWFADCLPSPPTLLISGPDMGDAITLFRLLHCVCRRPVVLADLSRNAFLALAPLGATLLVNQPDLSPRVRTLWGASNYRGVHVFGNGRVNSLASSKAIFLGMTDARWNDGVHLALPPTGCTLTPVDEARQSEIAEELQPQLLDYRLRHLNRVRNFAPSKLDSIFVSSEVARSLAASVLGEAEILESMGPLLRRFENDRIAQSGCDVHVAMIEVAWAPSHADRELSVSRLTELTNALLRSRGEILEYSPDELGWKLRNFGFRRHRNGRGMVLQFTHENRLLVHRLAAAFRLKLPARAKCASCLTPEDIDSKSVM